MRFFCRFLCLNLLFLGTLDVKANDFGIKDYYYDSFLEENDVLSPRYSIPSVFKTKNLKENFWDGMYLGGTLVLKDSTNFKTDLQNRQGDFKQRSFVLGYNKQFYKNSFNIIIGAEAFVEQNKSSIVDTSINGDSSIRPISNNFIEDSINKGLRITVGSSFNILKPYIWLGVYQNSFKDKNVISGKYNLEYGSGLDLAINSHLDIRIAYKFRNIQYLKEIATSVPRRRSLYNKVNYNTNDVDLGLLLHF